VSPSIISQGIGTLTHIITFNSKCMPSYIYRRQLAPSQTRETLDEVRTRLTEELRLSTEERVSHWNQLGDWCRQRPGRYIGVEWRPDLRGGSSSAAEEATSKVTGAVVEEDIAVLPATTPITASKPVAVSKRRS
jgi:hypothetical protein